MTRKEFQLNDRLSFIRFVGLEMKDKIPDAKTIWHFKDELAKTNTGKKLFKRFSSIFD